MPYIDFELGFLYNIQNDDYIMMYLNIFKILDKAKFETEFLKDKIEYTRRHIKIHESFLFKDLSHEDTVKIQEISVKRRQMMASMRDIIDSYKFMKTERERESVKLLTSWIRNIRKDIKSRNTIYEWNAAHYMEHTVRKNAEYKEALEDLRLTHLHKEIVECTKAILAMQYKRRGDKITKRETKQKRQRSLKDLNVLLWVINAMVVNDDDEGRKAREVGELINITIKRERTLYRFRKTLNKKKLEKKKQQKEQEQQEQQEKQLKKKQPENKNKQENQEKDKQQQGNKDTQTGNED